MFTEEELTRIEKLRKEVADRDRKYGAFDYQKEEFLNWMKSGEFKKYLEDKYGKEDKKA